MKSCKDVDCCGRCSHLAAEQPRSCSLPLSPVGQGRREKEWENLWVEIKTGKSLTKYCCRQNSLNFWIHIVMHHKYLINDSHIGKQIKTTNIYSFREKNPLSSQPQLYFRPFSFPLPSLHSPCYHGRWHSVPLGRWWALHSRLSQPLSASHSSLLLLHHSLSFLLSILFLHGLLFLHGCTCSNTGSPVGHGSFAVEHLLLLWPSASLWFLCLPSFRIFALS